MPAIIFMQQAVEVAKVYGDILSPLLILGTLPSFYSLELKYDLNYLCF
jgi:hypothetical protein